MAARVTVRPMIVEADELLASHDADGKRNPLFPASLQPRDRGNRKPLLQQARSIAADVKPQLLMPAAQAGAGAPIVGADGLVESGNGRVIGIRIAYGEKLPGAEKYRAALADAGYPIAGFNRPVLVQQRLTEMDKSERQTFAVDANTSTVAAQGAAEIARSDAGRISESLLDAHVPGPMKAPANRDFVRGMFRDVFPESDHVALMTADGSLSQAGVIRIENALFALAYGDADLLASLREDTEGKVRTLGAAMVGVAPGWAKMRAAVRNGRIAPDADATEPLIEAVKLVDKSRHVKESLAELVQQTDAFETRDPLVEDFLRLMFRNTDQWVGQRSQGRIERALSDYAEMASATQAGNDLLGNAPPTAADIVAAAAAKQGREEAKEKEAKSRGRGQREMFQRARPGGGPRLRATHTLPVEHLRDAMNTGLVAPSVAITPADVPHRWGGNASVDLVLKAGAIDPRRDNVTAGDGWTPSHPNIRLVPTVPYSKVRDAEELLLERYSKIVGSVRAFPNLTDHRGIIDTHGELHEVLKTLVRQEKGEQGFENPNWATDYLRRIGVPTKTVIHAGSDSMGRPKWRDATVDNIIRTMKREWREQEGNAPMHRGETGARLLPKIRTLGTMWSEAGRRIGSSTRIHVNFTTDELAVQIQRYATALRDAGKTSGPFFQTDAVADALVAAKGDAAAAARDLKRRFDVEAPDGWIDDTNAAVAAIRDSKVPYFEAKPLRRIPMSDVAAVIAPKAFPRSLRAELENRGIPVLTKDADMTDAELAALQSVPESLFQRRLVHGTPADFDAGDIEPGDDGLIHLSENLLQDFDFEYTHVFESDIDTEDMPTVNDLGADWNGLTVARELREENRISQEDYEKITGDDYELARKAEKVSPMDIRIKLEREAGVVDFPDGVPDSIESLIEEVFEKIEYGEETDISERELKEWETALALQKEARRKLVDLLGIRAVRYRNRFEQFAVDQSLRDPGWSVAVLDPSILTPEGRDLLQRARAGEDIGAIRRRDVTDALQRIGREVFGRDLNVRVEDSITTPEGERATGSYSPATGLAKIALRADDDAMTHTLWHEGLHHLRNVDAINATDWNLLREQAKHWRRRYGIDERYGSDGEPDMEAHLDEEAIAEALARLRDPHRQDGLHRARTRAVRSHLAIHAAGRERSPRKGISHLGGCVRAGNHVGSRGCPGRRRQSVRFGGGRMGRHRFARGGREGSGPARCLRRSGEEGRRRDRTPAAGDTHIRSGRRLERGGRPAPCPA